MILIRFAFDLDLYLDLDLILICLDFDLIWLDFGLIWIRFCLDLAPRTSKDLLGSPMEASKPIQILTES